jgi:hypothetical protein
MPKFEELRRHTIMSSSIRSQIGDAYERMAVEARYRPAAPSDGFGNITVPQEELDLEQERWSYAERWWDEEDNFDFFVGCCNGATRPATIFAVEAARNLCCGTPGDTVALRLLRMAVQELEGLGVADV